MTKTLHVRITVSRQIGGTHAYDAADGAELTNVVAVRFEHRTQHLPIVVLELQGGALYVTEEPLGLVELERSDEETPP